MKHVLTLCLSLALGVGGAKESYFGGGVSLYLIFPMAIVQAGFKVAENVHVRTHLDSVLVINTLGSDFLYTFSNQSLELYAGAGADMIGLLSLPSDAEYPNVFFGIHGTFGFEVRQDAFGYFLELQPGLAFLDQSQPFLKTRAGINFYYRYAPQNE